MLLVFGSAKLLDELSERIRQPGIVGQIVAGVLLGPSVLGWVSPDDLFSALTELGLMFLLFQAGLGVKRSELVRSSGTASLVAVFGVVVPFFAGWALISAWGYTRMESVFVGAAMVATSVGITAHVLTSRGLLRERASTIILGAAVIDDVLGLLVLALVSSFARRTANLLDLCLTVSLGLGCIAIVVKWGAKTAGMAIERLRHRRQSGETQFSVAIVLMFSLSLLAVYAGIAAIVGAFLAGMILSESVDQHVRDMSQGLAEVLVPFFLVGIGLRFDVKSFVTWPILSLSFLLFFVAVISKFLGCGLGSYRLGWKDAVRVGVGMIPRGEVGMVVAQIGVAFGVMSSRMYDAVVFMVITTSITAPLLLKISYKEIRSHHTNACRLVKRTPA